ncbi:MAG: type VI secretion system tube protein Hcp [Nitrospira sp.]|nr:type VI secretion system tube protein Hcp [Nitrospira sp.]
MAATQTEQTDYFLKIEGIEGESRDENHQGEVDITRFTWGESNKGMQGGSSARVAMQEFHFTTKVNKASPKLFVACAEGTVYKKAVLTCRKGGGDGRQNYLIWTFENVRVCTYEQVAGGSAETVVPVETFALTFDIIKMGYSEQKPDGTLEGEIGEGWDKPNNKKIQ